VAVHSAIDRSLVRLASRVRQAVTPGQEKKVGRSGRKADRANAVSTRSWLRSAPMKWSESGSGAPHSRMRRNLNAWGTRVIDLGDIDPPGKGRLAQPEAIEASAEDDVLSNTSTDRRRPRSYHAQP